MVSKFAAFKFNLYRCDEAQPAFEFAFHRVVVKCAPQMEWPAETNVETHWWGAILVKLTPVDPELETAWSQPLHLYDPELESAWFQPLHP
jgi:hypothetical protein